MKRSHLTAPINSLSSAPRRVRSPLGFACAGALTAAALATFPASATAQSAAPTCEQQDDTITCTFDGAGNYEFELPELADTFTITATGASAPLDADESLQENGTAVAETVTSTIDGLSGTLFVAVGGEEFLFSDARTEADDPSTRLVLAAGGDGLETSHGDDVAPADPDAPPVVTISYAVSPATESATGAEGGSANAAPAQCRGLCIDDTIFRLYELIAAN